MEARRGEPAGASTRSMGGCSTSCCARPTTSAGCPRAPSRARRSTPGSPSATRTPCASTPRWCPSTRRTGVRVHLLEPDPALPYQVFARDSSDQRARRTDRHAVRPVVAAGRVRAGHPLLPGTGDPDQGDGHGGLVRGRRLHDRRARRGRDRHGRGAHPGAGGAPGRRAGSRPRAGRCAWSGSRRTSCTSTCSRACWARSWPRCAWSRPRTASCAGCARRAWRSCPVTLAAALKLGVNGVALGGDRVLSTAESKDLNERLRALGLTVYDPELSAFTLGGGGAHCLMQAIRRERVG